MRPFLYALIAAALAATPALADQTPPLCKALRALGDEARRAHEPQRISADVNFAAPAPCRPATDNPSAWAFCDVAAQESGLAYRLLACVANFADEPLVTTRDQYAEGRSRKAITHLTASLVHGVRLDLAEAGGHYDIVVWAPK